MNPPFPCRAWVLMVCRRRACTQRALATDAPAVGRLNHVAVAVPNLVEAAAKFKSVLGAAVSEPQALPEHGVTAVFVTLPNTKVGGRNQEGAHILSRTQWCFVKQEGLYCCCVQIELLEPLGLDSPIAGYLSKNPAGGIHHICLEVDDIAASAAHANTQLCRVLGDIKTGAHGLPVCFLHPKDMCGVLTELEEVKKTGS